MSSQQNCVVQNIWTWVGCVQSDVTVHVCSPTELLYTNKILFSTDPVPVLGQSRFLTSERAY